MDTYTYQHRDYRFLLGLLAGTCVGAGLVAWLAPRATGEIRDRVTDSAGRLGKRAAEQYRQARRHAAEAADELGKQGIGVCDDVTEAVARGAHEVERVLRSASSKPS
jgi:gas vesicle protein